MIALTEAVSDTLCAAYDLGWYEAMSDAKCPIDMPRDREELAILLGELGFKFGAEIGVEQGLYAEVLCRANPDLQLLCVDAWQAYAGYREHVSQEKLDGFYAATRARLKHYNVQLFRAFSVAAAKEVEDGSLDFIYIDAAHDLPSVIADLAAWVPKVRVGGVCAGHDFRKVKGTGPFHVPQAIQAWTSAYRIAPWYVLRGDTAPSWFWVKADA